MSRKSLSGNDNWLLLSGLVVTNALGEHFVHSTIIPLNTAMLNDIAARSLHGIAKIKVATVQQ